jgi:hypothetical protein
MISEVPFSGTHRTGNGREGRGGAAVSRNKIKGSSQKSKSVETVEGKKKKKKKYHRTYISSLYPASRQAGKQAA